jgi:hypothetical protein
MKFMTEWALALSGPRGSAARVEKYLLTTDIARGTEFSNILSIVNTVYAERWCI